MSNNPGQAGGYHTLGFLGVGETVFYYCVSLSNIEFVDELSQRLMKEFGQGFSSTNIKQMRSFYLIYSKGQTVFDAFNLSWSYYLKLMRIDDDKERRFYEIESYKTIANPRYTSLVLWTQAPQDNAEKKALSKNAILQFVPPYQ